MVLRRMGLLDDAIREHLELKRRRGADPGEVAREQREVLDALDHGTTAPGPATTESSPDAPAVSGGPLVDRGGEATAETAASDVEQDVLPAGPGGAAEPAERPEHSGSGAGETAELDMSSVLGGDAPLAAAADVGSESVAETDSLEWEMPAGAAAPETPGEEGDEDVLEETPDFLRDTPEQDRLWFEQRPPRDFDFDK
jgi:hypothetical protein